MERIEPGQVFFVRKLRALREGSGYSEFSAGRGRSFVVLVLGIEEDGKGFDAFEAMRRIGWKRVTE